MKGLGLVFIHEVRYRLGRKSFLLTTFLLPILVTAIYYGIAELQASQAAPSIAHVIRGPAGASVNGVVDQAGIIDDLPPDLERSLRLFPDERSAQEALQAGDIRLYYVLPVDFLSSHQVEVVQAEENLLAAAQTRPLRTLLLNNLLDDLTLAAALLDPIEVREVPLMPETPQRGRAHPLTFLIPYATMLLFYLLVLTTASLLLLSLNRERENRVLEVLLGDLKPGALLGGKMLALGILGLLQEAIWVGLGYSLLRAGGRVYHLPPAFRLPPAFLVWAGLFFLLGYLIYGSLMLILGVLFPDSHDATQFTILIMIPMIIPLFLLSAIIEQPHGGLAVAFSLFPLTAPEVMMTRLAAGGVPTWQVLLSLGLMAATATLVLYFTGRLLKPQVLLNGLSVRWPWQRWRQPSLGK